MCFESELTILAVFKFSPHLSSNLSRLYNHDGGSKMAT